MVPQEMIEPDLSSPRSHRALVGDALDLLFEVLRPYVERQFRAVYGDDWLRVARGEVHNKPPARWDTSDLLTMIYFKFAQAFRDMGHEGRSWVSLLKEVRKKWAHQKELTLTETRRTLETAILLLRAIGHEAEAARLEPHMLTLMQDELRTRLDAPDAPPAPDYEAVREVPAAEPVRDEAAEAPLLARGLRHLRRMAARREPEEPLELRRDLLDAVERAVTPLRRDGAFNEIVLHVLARDGQTRLRYEAALGGVDEPFREALVRRLAEARLPAPAGLRVHWRYYREVPARLQSRFADAACFVEVLRRAVASSATLRVVQGVAGQSTYAVGADRRVTIGRLAEVTDAAGRLVRRNTVAFVDDQDPALDAAQQEVHRTVSRAHAVLAFDAATATFRLRDEQSTSGTVVVREGYPVPIQVRRQAVALQDGDLLYFGKACLLFRLAADGAEDG